MATFGKEPAENYVIGIEFAGKLPTGRTLSSSGVSAIDLEDETDATSTVLGSSTATIDETRALVRVKAGANGARYKITFLTELDDMSILEEQLIMNVLDL
jgi:hypothetical protein